MFPMLTELPVTRWHTFGKFKDAMEKVSTVCTRLADCVFQLHIFVMYTGSLRAQESEKRENEDP